MNVKDFYTYDEGFSNDLEFCDWCLGQAVQALVDDNREETASLMLSCRVTWQRSFYDFFGSKSFSDVPIIFGPIAAIKHLRPQPAVNDHGEPTTATSHHLNSFDEVLRLILGKDYHPADYQFQIETTSLPANWRDELLGIAHKKGTTNQGLYASKNSSSVVWNNLHFGSPVEVKIAQALDKVAVMYFANCTARVSLGGDRVNREPDFLIFHNGRCGILEVDGAAYHPPAHKVQEDERDRLFKHHGVLFVEHYDATRCIQEPHQVVADFLTLLAKYR